MRIGHMKYTLSETVNVDIRIDGQDASATYEAGDVELPPAIAELLVAQGFASEAVTTKKSKTSETTTDTTTTEA